MRRFERGALGTLAALATLCTLAAGAAGLQAETKSPAPNGSPKVLLIGVDGADMDILDRLAGQGRLPTFARLKREGAWGRLRSLEPMLSPLIWTTIATGRRPEDHGILDFLEVTPGGEATPITSSRRKVPALWNILSGSGFSSGFIGWYASYPAEAVKGFVVSDRMAFHQVKSARAQRGATHPESLREELERSLGEPVPDPGATRTRFLPGGAKLSADGERRLGELAKIHATSEYYRRAAPALQARFHPDLLAVYFEGIDAAGHLFMEDAPPRRHEVTEEDFRAFSSVVDRYYEYQDEVLSDLLRLEGEDTVTIVVSDHGFKTGARRPVTSGRADTGLAPLWHLLHGVVFVHGRPARAGSEVRGATVLDIAPTILDWLGAPISKELPGRVLKDAFRPGAVPAERVVDRYPVFEPPAAPAEASSDPEAVQKLAALGYLSGAGKRLPHDADGRTTASYLNEGSARAAGGDLSGALRCFGKAAEIDPVNVNAIVFGARIYTMRGEAERARTLLDRGLALKPGDSGVRLQRASWALRTGDLPMARAELEAARKIDDKVPLLHLLTARLLDAARSPEAALKELSEAEALTDADALLAEILSLRVQISAEMGLAGPAETALGRLAAVSPSTDVTALRGDVAMARRDPRTAAAQYRRAATANPRDPALQRKLGKALAATGELGAAEEAFGQAVTAATTPPEKEGAYGDLSTFYEFAGRESAAVETLEKAARALPSSAAVWAMLGAAHGRSDRPDDAIAAYEKSVAIAPSPLALKTLAALVYEHRKDTARAVTLWRRSLALDPDQPDVKGFLEKYAGNQ